MYRHEKELWAKVALAGLFFIAALTFIIVEMYRDVMTRGSCQSIIRAAEWLPSQYGEYPLDTDLLIHEMAEAYSWNLACQVLQPSYYGRPQMLLDADRQLRLDPHQTARAQAGDLLYWSDGRIMHLGYLNRFKVIIRVI